MTKPIISFTIMLMMGCSLASAEDKKAEMPIEALVEHSRQAICRIESLHEQFEKVHGARPRPDDLDRQLEALRIKTAEARADLDRLIAVIKVGQSIFSYPGLLGLGSTSYVSSKDTDKNSRGIYYLEFLIGHSDTDSGGTERRRYQVQFDSSGIILSNRVLPRELE